MFKELRGNCITKRNGYFSWSTAGLPNHGIHVFAEVSVREESDNDQIQSDEAEAEASPTKSPTTPKNVKCKNSSGSIHSVPDATAMSLSLGDMKQEHLHPMLTGHLHPSSPPKGRIYQWHKMADQLCYAFSKIQALQLFVFYHIRRAEV